ncbi:class I SAM-dependent methyltransferase [Bacillus solitudinis]|uniref:class I SAM-dependent methyltransferase n=1 Tax=Bacillus solitudinis TaxID=2014074 RepID=UPI000C2494D3|nr:class I SAM-dependent methyltransferase [Bacillus solitudinis]
MYIDALAKLGVGGSHPGGLSLSKELLESQTIHAQTEILDVGCGTGLTSVYLYTHFNCRVTACDKHLLMIKKANQRFQLADVPVHATYEIAESLSYQEEIFDFVLSESVTAFTNISKSLAEYYRVLKQGGKFIAIEMSHDETLDETELKKMEHFYGIKNIRTRSEWVEDLKANGFLNIKVQPFHVDKLQTNSEYDFNPSPELGPEIYDTIVEHEDLMSIYRSNIVPLILTAEK